MAENKIETELLSQIKEVLLTFPKYWEEDVLLRNRVAEDLRSYDQELIEALLSNKLVKDTYSITLDSTNIFKIEEFISMLRYKNYWENSYTKYSNEIGLTSGGKYLNYNTDVVLDFPHKDSVLEGGMTKEDIGKKEIYYHNVLAKEEIDTLLSFKVLSNIKKYNKDGVHEITQFTNKDNLIIKGNNLVALHSLKEKYRNKVKMIYIDPPYNTGNDSFKYNDKFNRSTWLTFMKNRLEVAKIILKNNGVIFVQCDDNEIGYLNVLMDDIFGEENKLCIFPRITKRGGKSSTEIAKNHDYILLYSKSKDDVELYAPEHDDDGFNNKDEYFEERGYYKLNQTLDYDSLQYSSSLDYPIKIDNEVLYPGGDKELHLSRKKGNHKRADWAWRWSKSLFNYGLENGFIELKEGRDRKRIYTKTYQGARIVSDNNEGYKVEKFIRTKPLSTLELTKNEYSNDNATKHSRALGISNLFDYTKPETMIAKLIKLTTKKHDIILDFFMGSATTQAVVHKMNRQYIGIEQMDYINTVSVPRLQKVIEGEQGGISKDVDWKGGGSFVYAELYSLNEKYVKDIQDSNSEADLEKVLTTVKESAYLNFKVDLEKVSSKNKGYKNLDLEEKKEVLIQVLDMNQLYLSYSEMEDEQYNIPEDVKAFNHSFYDKKGVRDE